MDTASKNEKTNEPIHIKQVNAKQLAENKTLELKYPEKMRINRFLAQAGLGSRRSVEELLRNSQVYCNGQLITELHFQVNPKNDQIAVEQDGRKRRVLLPGQIEVYMLHKPKGYLCSRSDPKISAPVVYDLLPLRYNRLTYIGRLDIDSSGLLLFTNDGMLLYRLTHPSYEVSRIYEVRLAKQFTPDQMESLRQGILIEGRRTGAVHLIKIEEDGYRVTIELKEGRNREVRRLFEAANNEVIELFRSEYSGLKIGNLASGKGRLLYTDEIELLKKSVGLR